MRSYFLRTFACIAVNIKTHDRFPNPSYLYKSRMMSEYIYYGNQANKVFLTVVESGSIGKAAQKLDVGASAISQQISKLEQELSIRLLQRNAFGVTPTPAGLAF